jgi:hypothetical protein
MELTEALKRHLPLQIHIPCRSNPLQTLIGYAAEVFLVETQHGPAVVWVDPFWFDKCPQDTCHIAYARPRGAARAGRWVDQEPRYGPRCLVCQKPFVIELVDRDSSAWPDCKAWRLWRAGKAKQCGRTAAWGRVEEVFGDLILERKL